MVQRILPRMAAGRGAGLLAILCLFLVHLPGVINQDASGFPSAQTAVNNFALDMYRSLVNEPGVSNLVFAPLSVSAALSAIYFGAEGETRSQIQTGLRFDDETGPEELTRRVAEFQADAAKQNGIKEPRSLLNIVTRIFLAQDINPNSDFSDIVGGTESLNFEDPSSAVERINSFVSEETEGRINGLISSNSIDKRTSMVLVNAIYFKGLWKTQFDETKKGKFNSPEGEQEVDFMFVTGSFKRAQKMDIETTVLELPYKNSDFSMFILLPFHADGYDAMEAGISELGESLFDKDMKEVDEMVVSIPKFGFQAQLDLTALLPALGIVDVFDAEKSDLSGISDGQDLHVSDAIHRALIQVDEVGTVGAAATQVSAVPLSAPPMFVADRPFMFVIRDNVEKMVLFMGRVMRI